MKISYLWLKTICNISQRPTELADLLTRIGLEVNSITPFSFIPKGLVVGQILQSTPHPNANRLLKVTVDVGQDAPLSIICGAPNVEVGNKAVVALPGTTLTMPHKQQTTIRKVSIRGEISEGMLCSESELGIGDAEREILALQTSHEPGTPLEKVWNTPEDTIFEIELTPNRNDVISHFGVARDIAAACGQVLERRVLKPLISCDSLPLRITVKDNTACPRYTGVMIQGVKMKPSPIWLQRCLRSIGYVPINIIVDITTFLMSCFGQPLHAYDYDHIAKKKIIVQKLPKGTKFTTLDSVVRTLTGEELMVCDSEGPLCMAGIVGGERGKITKNTTNVFLESAYFEPITIYKAHKHHKIQTDASLRFMRGIDPSMTYMVLKKAASMVQKYAGGTIASVAHDHYPNKIACHEIPITYTYIARLTGMDIPKEDIHKILTNLKIKIKEEKSTGFTAIIPPYRSNVTRPADLVEEILRMYGYNRENTHPQPHFQRFHAKKNPFHQRKSNLKKLLAAQGYHEIVTNSLASSHHPHASPKERIFVLHPLSQALNSLRKTMLFVGLEVVQRNVRHNQSTIKLFEIGKVYHRTPDTFHENEKLAIWLAGLQKETSWLHPKQQATFFDLCAIVKTIFSHANLPMAFLPIVHPHYSQCIALQHKETLYGYMGQVHGDITTSLNLKTPIFFAEIDLAAWKRPTPPQRYTKIPKYPSVTRDISLAIPATTSFLELQRTITQMHIPALQHFHLIDYYQGKPLADHQKGYTVRLVLQSPKQTMDEKQITKTIQRIATGLKQTLSADVRD